MSSRARILVVDAPGGPRPELYMPTLAGEFEVHAVWLAIESPESQRSRRDAFAPARVARAVADPREVESVALDVAKAGVVHGVVAFSERVVHLAQRVAYALGLPANPPDTLDALQNKYLQRERLRAAGVPVPAVRVLESEADCAAAAARFTFPAVLKPSIGMGSLATFRVESAEELAAVWRWARDLVATDNRVAHLRPALLLEEELIGDPATMVHDLGDYVSVESVTVEGRTHVLSVSDKLRLAYPFRENACIMPSIRAAGERESVMRSVLDAHRALGVQFGFSHTEVKLTRQGPRIIELNGRIGGGIPELLYWTADYDVGVEHARLSTGQPVRVDARFSRYAGFMMPQPPVGRHRVLRAPDTEQLRATELVTISHVAKAGSIVDSAVGTASHLVKGIAVAPRHADVVSLGYRLSGPEFFELEPVTGDAAQ